MSVEFYRNLYEDEWVRRAEVRQSASLPAGVLALLAGVLVFYARSYSYPPGWISYVFVVSLAVASSAFMMAVYMLCRSFFGPKYRRIPWPSQLRDYEEGLLRFYKSKGDDATSANEEWEVFLVDRYVDASNRNSENNANAGEYLHKANRAVVVALIATGLGAGPVILDSRTNQTTPQRVEIINLEELRDDRSERPVSPSTDRQPADDAPVPVAGDADSRDEARRPGEH